MLGRIKYLELLLGCLSFGSLGPYFNIDKILWINIIL